MFDVDWMEEQLERALTGEVHDAPPPRPRVAAAVPAPPARPAKPKGRPKPAPAPGKEATRPRPPAPAPAPPPAASAGIAELLEAGLLEELDGRLAARARTATDDRSRLDAATWSTMRALLDGRRSDAGAALAVMLDLARSTDDPEAWDRHWRQRHWAALEWGDESERRDVLDHCRERAYRFDDLLWWGPLTLLLAELGKADEATRAFDEATRLVGGAPTARVYLDVVTDLIEAAAILGDAGRAVAAHRCLDAPAGRLVVAGPGVVCKGSVERYRALGHSAAGHPAEAGECFRLALDAHRAIGAGALLDRTRRQAERYRRAA